VGRMAAWSYCSLVRGETFTFLCLLVGNVISLFYLMSFKVNKNIKNNSLVFTNFNAGLARIVCQRYLFTRKLTAGKDYASARNTVRDCALELFLTSIQY
jgi:hypothetical protein